MARKQDRRRESRVPYRATAELVIGKKKVKEKGTRDISVTGTFVEGITDMGKGTQCAINIFLVGDASELLLKMQGEVVRVEESGVALEFIDVSRDCFYHLKNISYVISINPDDIICTNYKKPRASKTIVINDDSFDHTVNDEDDEYD